MGWFGRVVAATCKTLGGLFLLFAGFAWYEMYHQKAGGGEFDFTFDHSFYIDYIAIFSAMGGLFLLFGIVAGPRGRNR
jgi:hypothetical protein